jgi:CubicO group peptidase (beta-lactamase class C family)
MSRNAQHWQERLQVLADKHKVVGATLAISTGGDITTATAGVLNSRTGQPTTPDSLFQIGSITKVFTATLVMQLVEEGLLDLDAAVATYLPEFRVRDAAVSRTVTPRQLLSHTSGIDGDLFLDTGRGDDCLERYVAAMADLSQVHPMGKTMSYCNSGYVLLGRLVEVLRDKSWDLVLRERLLAPLGLTSAGTLPEEALLYGAATGHLHDPATGEVTVTPQWGIYRSTGPAGLIHMTAADLLAFAHLHLAGGTTASGERLLSEQSAQQMLVPQVAVPDPWTLGSHWGLGWILMTWDGHAVYGHDGATLGQGGFLRIAPEAGLSVSLLTNGGQMRDLFQDLFTEVFADAGISMPAAPAPVSDAPAADAAAYTGRYAREGIELVVREGDDGLTVTIESSGALAVATGAKPQVFSLLPYQPDVFLARLPGKDSLAPAVFFALEDGSRYLHMGARSTPRTGEL